MILRPFSRPGGEFQATKILLLLKQVHLHCDVPGHFHNGRVLVVFSGRVGDRPRA
jgi:hypothetical protein